jgi:hypothetical protein
VTSDDSAQDELPVVAALRSLSIFSADQGGAYREHFASQAAVLGDDIQTKLGRHIAGWGRDGSPGVVVLTGNAGTGKTAVAEAYCRALGCDLPQADEPVEVADGRWVIKDLSGLPDALARERALRRSLDGVGKDEQALVCANEGVLRDALDSLAHQDFTDAVESALRIGAARVGSVMVVNVNRQRPTADGLWDELLDYVVAEQLWDGCNDCPFDLGGCPMRTNAAALRDANVRAQLRTLVRLGAGDAVPTMRELLAILSWAVVGGLSCKKVKADARDLDKDAFTATNAYYTRIVGGGLQADVIERSPLLTSMRRSGLGDVSDLEVDGWLRDSTGAPTEIRGLAGDPQYSGKSDIDAHESPALTGSASHLDRVRTTQGTMTFHFLGETVSTSEDLTKVEDGLDALVSGDGQSNAAAQTLWRQRLYFEATSALGGLASASRRLLDYRYLPNLIELAGKASKGRDTIPELTELIRGLNFLVTGFSSPHEGLVVPDPACLFARDPGSFRPAKPSLMHSQVQIERLAIAVPDRGLVDDVLDVDHVDVDLVVDRDSTLCLRIRPKMYEAIREAAEFQGPVGQGVAEMNDLRSFYGRLAAAAAAEDTLRVADPDSSPPALVRVNLPYLPGRRTR